MKFLENIPLLGDLMKLFPHMDYEGQKLAERVYQWVILLFGVVGFVWGYVCQEFAQTIYIVGAGCLLAAILVLPPWPFYRRHPVKWYKRSSDSSSSKSSNSGGSGSKQGKKKTKNN